MSKHYCKNGKCTAENMKQIEECSLNGKPVLWACPYESFKDRSCEVGDRVECENE